MMSHRAVSPQTALDIPAPCMMVSRGGLVPLCGVHGELKINDLFMETILEQTYENAEKVNIEAIYTFAVPMDAVLLELTIQLGDRELKGSVMKREEAERGYEDALVDGHSAGLLERAADGLMTMNIGNMMPGETAKVRLRFGQLLRFKGDEVRVGLPLTIAPRYGDPAAAGLAEHQDFEHTLEDFAGFSLSVVIEGMLAGASVDSPSHPLVRTRHGNALHLGLGLASERVPLDRDFVLSMRQESPDEQGAFAFLGRDGKRSVILAGFKPRCPEGLDTGPAQVKILVDCSGSMNGDSMAQAKKGLKKILDHLRPQDRFSLTTFGSSHKHHHSQMIPASESHMAQARQILKSMSADMGGTELRKALNAVYALPGWEQKGVDVLLITDGEVNEGDALLQKARSSGHRVFTVGVGSAVCEPTVRGLADSTGGACELVSPNEDMAHGIYRQFLRMSRPQAVIKALTWPITPKSQAPAAPVVFAEDTLFVAAFLKGEAQGHVTLELDWGQGQPQVLSAPIQNMDPVDMDPEPQANGEPGDLAQGTASQEPGNIVRVAASMLIAETKDRHRATELSLRYQLVSKHTSYLLVSARGENEKAVCLPVLRKTPHTRAAGWGGSGSVFYQSLLRQATACFDGFHDVTYNAVAPQSRASAPPPQKKHTDLKAFIKGFNVASGYATPGTIMNIGDMKAMGLAKDMVKALERLVEEGHAEQEVVVAFLLVLEETPEGRQLSRHAKRLIAWCDRSAPPHDELVEKVRNIIQKSGNIILNDLQVPLFIRK